MSKGVTLIWAIVSILFTLAVIFAYVTPVWFENKEMQNLSGNVTLNVSFGPLRYCSKSQFDNVLIECKFYTSLMNIPSTTWILCGVVYALGCSLLFTALCCALVGCCLKEETWERVRLSAAYLQLFGGKTYYFYPVTFTHYHTKGSRPLLHTYCMCSYPPSPILGPLDSSFNTINLFFLLTKRPIDFPNLRYPLKDVLKSSEWCL